MLSVEYVLFIFILLFGKQTLAVSNSDQPLFECVGIHESNIPKACQPFVTYDSIAVPQGENLQTIQANTEYQLRLWLANEFDCRSAATRYICFNSYRYCGM